MRTPGYIRPWQLFCHKLVCTYRTGFETTVRNMLKVHQCCRSSINHDAHRPCRKVLIRRVRSKALCSRDELRRGRGGGRLWGNGIRLQRHGRLFRLRARGPGPPWPRPGTPLRCGQKCTRSGCTRRSRAGAGRASCRSDRASAAAPRDCARSCRLHASGTCPARKSGTVLSCGTCCGSAAPAWAPQAPLAANWAGSWPMRMHCRSSSSARTLRWWWRYSTSAATRKGSLPYPSSLGNPVGQPRC
mmetsp:Transcript_109606/g.309837  ORF Transcript_109606/g.309837 Transcript_109606/m.309837 type:complete len:244 (-) Transcript_109606:573-1304(-)